MDSIRNSVQKCPHDVLYHYTTQNGLIRIITEKRIWATNMRYLNDAKEFEYAIELAQKILREYRTDEGDFLNQIAELVNSREGLAVYVCSFSGEKDQLSQWRGYTRGTKGFSIGFDSSELKALADKQGFLLTSCIYDRQEQEKLIKKIIDKALDHLATTTFYGSDIDDFNLDLYLEKLGQARSTFAHMLFSLAPKLKHPSFNEENEWRLISTAKGLAKRAVHFRPGPSTIVPYIHFSLSEEKEGIPIKRIVVGPTPNAQLSKHSLASLLACEQVKDCNIAVSEIPYRDW